MTARLDPALQTRSLNLTDTVVTILYAASINIHINLVRKTERAKDKAKKLKGGGLKSKL